MARKRSRGRHSSSGLARRTPTRLSPLDHPASPLEALSELLPDVIYPDVGVFSDPVRTPLIRTVRIVPPPPRSSRLSPTLQVRATFRSSSAPARNPYLQAQLITPRLPERSLICAKRTIRREVLFAVRGTGKGAKSSRRRKSKTRC